jgi:aryl-alcohol dehydrogenase-like predicted oxidoreductase
LGDKKMDVVSIARNPPAYSNKEIAEALITLRDEGWFEHIGTSETSKATMEEFGKVGQYPITSPQNSTRISVAVNCSAYKARADSQYFTVANAEIEVSLWSYESEMQDAVKYCADNKIPVFCYSPLGRGFLSRKWKTPEDIPKGSFQARSPRFQGEAFYANLKLVDQLDELAEKKGVKTTQLALAWITSLSPYVSEVAELLVLWRTCGFGVGLICRTCPFPDLPTPDELRRMPKRPTSSSPRTTSRRSKRPWPRLKLSAGDTTSTPPLFWYVLLLL